MTDWLAGWLAGGRASGRTDLLHELGEGDDLVDARDGRRQVLVLGLDFFFKLLLVFVFFLFFFCFFLVGFFFFFSFFPPKTPQRDESINYLIMSGLRVAEPIESTTFPAHQNDRFLPTTIPRLHFLKAVHPFTTPHTTH
jgi:hypothetical protein